MLAAASILNDLQWSFVVPAELQSVDSPIASTFAKVAMPFLLSPSITIIADQQVGMAVLNDEKCDLAT